MSRTAEGYFEIFEMATETGVTAAKATHVCGRSGLRHHQRGRAGRPGAGDRRPVRWRDHRQPGGWRCVLASRHGARELQPGPGLSDDRHAVAAICRTRFPSRNVIQNGTLFSSVWNAGPDAVTATLLGNAVTNEYVLDTGTKSQTSWIITMPTKYAYVNGSDAPLDPFTSTYKSGIGACEATFAVVFNREEASPQIVTSDDFSPNPPGAPGPTICWEATSVNFNDSNVFGSTNINKLSTAFSNGWSTFGFNDPIATPVHQMIPLSTTTFDLAAGTTAGAQLTYYGLPVVGFTAETFQNDAIVVNGKSFLSTFGVEFVHHKTTFIGRFSPP